MKKVRVLVVHGPNISLLGEREREIYGTMTLYDVNRLLEEEAEKMGIYLVTFQSDDEGELIKAIHNARGRFDYIIINPGGLTHTSVSLRDALLAVDIPFIEVHMSNVSRREEFRRKSLFSDRAMGVVYGFGWRSYIIALYSIWLGEKN